MGMQGTAQPTWICGLNSPLVKLQLLMACLAQKLILLTRRNFTETNDTLFPIPRKFRIRNPLA
jgi:hypothetical protein